MTSDTITILLVDDHELIRSGLGAVLDLEPDMDVVGVVGDASSLCDSVRVLDAQV